MVFSAISSGGFSIEADNDTDYLVSVGWGKTNKKYDCSYALFRHIGAVIARMKPEQGKLYSSQLLYPNRIGTVWYLAVSANALGPVHSRRWGGGGGGGGGSVYSMWQVLHLMWLSVHYFPCWSTPEVILFSWSFHLLLDPGYRASPASHKKCSVSASTGTGNITFYWYHGNIFRWTPPPPPTICRSSCYHDLENWKTNVHPLCTRTEKDAEKELKEGRNWRNLTPRRSHGMH